MLKESVSTMNGFIGSEIEKFSVRDMLEITLQGSSKGNQRKWITKNNEYVKEQFYFQDRYWKDYLVEVIASRIGSYFSEYQCVVQQRVCLIDDSFRVTHGCVSKNFCSEGECFLSYRRLCTLFDFEFDLTWDYKKKYESILNAIREITALDVKNYLDVMIIIDYLVGNEDRHLNNFGVIQTETGFKVAPLFDFGLGLFEHDECYLNNPFRQCLQMMQAKPFSSNNQLITDFVLENTNIALPKEIDLSGIEVPSPKAGSYLRNRCLRIGIDLKGVD